jgi:hypothetical protein
MKSPGNPQETPLKPCITREASQEETDLLLLEPVLPVSVPLVAPPVFAASPISAAAEPAVYDAKAMLSEARSAPLWLP